MVFTVNLKSGLPWIPISFLLFTMIGLFTTFFIAKSYQQVSTPPAWPSISSTGAYPPTSCIFSMILVGASVIGFFVMLYYYQFLRITGNASAGLNNTLLGMGIFVCMGTAMVGCNQRPNIAILHAIGALGAFFVGAAYCGVVTFVTWQISKRHEGSYPMWFLVLRAVLVIAELLSVFLMVFFSAQRSTSSQAMTIGNSFEWAVVGIQCLFFATMCVEFSNLERPSLVVELTHEAKEQFNGRIVTAAQEVRNNALTPTQSTPRHQW